MSIILPDNTLLIEHVLTTGSPTFLTLNTYKKYDKFYVVNPYASTSQNYYNISSKIGNNIFICTLHTDPFQTRTVVIPDGWIASPEIYQSHILQPIIDAFSDMGEEITMEIDPTTNKLNIASVDALPGAPLKTIDFTVPTNDFNESSNFLLGYPGIPNNANDSCFWNVSTTSPLAVDLFSNGRFFGMNITLNLFASSGYVSEPNTLITIQNKAEFGAYVERQDSFFEKPIFVNNTLINLILTITDRRNFQLDIMESVYLRFQIKCYNKEKD